MNLASRTIPATESRRVRARRMMMRMLGSMPNGLSRENATKHEEHGD